MKHLLLLCLSATFLFSCKDSAPADGAAEASTVDSTSITAPAEELTGLNLLTFSNLPVDIKGCSCLASSDSTEFKNATYVYADNDKGTAYVNLNGILTKLEKQSASQNGATTLKVFSNDHFELTVELTKAGTLAEGEQYNGRMSLKPKRGAIIMKNLYGRCSGC